MGLSAYLAIFSHKKLIHINANLKITLSDTEHKSHEAYRNFIDDNFLRSLGKPECK